LPIVLRLLELMVKEMADARKVTQQHQLKQWARLELSSFSG
jgi:hypothetical protein